MSTTQTPTRPATINGLPLKLVEDLAARVQADPRSGVCEFRVTTDWTSGARSRTNVRHWSLGGATKPRDFTIESDEPTELAGDATAPNPQELLMAALNACMTVGYVAGCALQGIELSHLQIESRGSLDLRGFLGLDPEVPPGYRDVHYTVRIAGNGTPEQFEAIHRAVQATSPNFWNISQPVRLHGKLEVR